MEVDETIKVVEILCKLGFDRDVIIGTILGMEDGYSMGFAISEAIREHLSGKDWISRLNKDEH